MRPSLSPPLPHPTQILTTSSFEKLNFQVERFLSLHARQIRAKKNLLQIVEKNNQMISMARNR